jgi:hypothetical protein
VSRYDLLDSDINSLRTSIRFQARLVRRYLRRKRQQIRFRGFAFDTIPILFANSFPKSGTHLLTQILQGFTEIGPAVDSGLPAIVTYQGDTGRRRSVQEILADLERLLPGDIAYGHLHADTEIINQLSQDEVACYLILRDPRDVVVSHVHYVTEMTPNHIHHHYYHDELKNFDERLRTSILGLSNSPIPFPDIGARFEPYLGWLDSSKVLVIHFEELISDRQESVGRIFDYAVQNGFRSKLDRNKAVRRLTNNIDPQRSPTFRSGKIGGWKTRFTPDHIKLFKEVAGDTLIRLGYEQDNNW